jgi:selenoprotein W-related protein
MNDLNLPLYQRKVQVSIEYCVPCDYSEYALATARELIKNYQHVIEQLTFRMGSKGVFEVKADEEVLFSKKTMGRHPRPGEVLQAFKALVGPEVPTYP